MLKLTSLVALGLLALAPGAARAQGDAEAGKLKVYTCTGCHGIPGYKNVYPHYHVPKIAGQNEAYLIAALAAYRRGERPHPTMQAQAEGYSEQDIADIAAYLASLAQQADQ